MMSDKKRLRVTKTSGVEADVIASLESFVSAITAPLFSSQEATVALNQLILMCQKKGQDLNRLRLEYEFPSHLGGSRLTVPLLPSIMLHLRETEPNGFLLESKEKRMLKETSLKSDFEEASTLSSPLLSCELTVHWMGMLRSGGYNINEVCQDLSGCTPLIIAMAYGQAPLAPWLLEHGAYINAKEEQGRSALSYAILKGGLEATRLLLEYQANINIQDRLGQNLLMYSLWNLHQDSGPAIFRLLLENGIDVNAQKKGGGTIWHGFANALGAGKNQEHLPLLVESGADILLKDDQGNTVIHALLKDLSRSISMEPCLALIDEAFRGGVSLDAVNANGYTALHLAADIGEMEIAKWLIEHGANPSLKEKSGKKAKDLAKGYGHLMLVEYLDGAELARNEKAHLNDLLKPISDSDADLTCTGNTDSIDESVNSVSGSAARRTL